MKKLCFLLIFVTALASVASAKRFVTVKDGKEVVAHTNLAPVVVHKILPPYGLGKHVYAGKAANAAPQDSRHQPTVLQVEVP